MKYSINPFKWLAWLRRYARYHKYYRNSKDPKFFYPARPLNKKGKAEVMQKLKAAHEKTKFKPPIARNRTESEE